MAPEEGDHLSGADVRESLRRIEASVESARREFREAIREHVTTGVFEARMDAMGIRVQAADDRARENEDRLNTKDAQDRSRNLAIFIAVLTAFLGPLAVALILRGG